jgi:hypothetical protein
VVEYGELPWSKALVAQGRTTTVVCWLVSVSLCFRVVLTHSHSASAADSDVGGASFSSGPTVLMGRFRPSS